ncbi:MAG: DUF3806 domain-containing protein [Pseudomonadales bacterium]
MQQKIFWLNRQQQSLLLVAFLAMVTPLATAEEEDTSITTLTPEQVENYRFQLPPSTVEVNDLTIGQRAIMAAKRRAAKDLLARQLGVVKIRGTEEDLRILQQVVDRKILTKSQIEEWQGLGILFGDILAHEFHLKWVNYEDELGANKALRYRDTENFFFPVTLFSKRVKFDEDIDMFEVYAKLEEQIKAVAEFESRPKLPNT